MSSSSAVAIDPSYLSPAGARLSLLTVFSDRREQAALLSIVGDSGWDVYSVDGFGMALALMRTVAIGVVVVQYRPHGGLCWRKLVDEAARLDAPPRIIVTDRLADDSMWAEVLNLGAHDLLMQPFHPSEVLYGIASAWHDWKRDHRRAA